MRTDRAELVKVPQDKRLRDAERQIQSLATAITRSVRTGRHHHLSDQAEALLAAQHDLAMLAAEWDEAVEGIRALGKLQYTQDDCEDHTRYTTITVARELAGRLDRLLELVNRAGVARTGLTFEVLYASGLTDDGLGTANTAIRDALSR